MTETHARVTTIVVDDEPVARAGLRHMLAEFEWIECIGDCASGPAALEAIERLRPELVFLDIDMPGFSGIELLRRLTHQPRVVFTTAYAEHAVTAFELGALDYMLKPFGSERLKSALDRARTAFGEPAASVIDRYGEFLGQGPMSRLFVRSGRSIVPLAVERVSWFEAIGDYVTVHEEGATHVLHLALNRIAARLDPQRFVRIHRTYIVNMDHVAAFRRQENGNLAADMRDGSVLAVSRAMSQELRGRAR